MSDLQRQQQLHAFAQHALGLSLPPPVAASSDASFRSYWRLRDAQRSWIVMDAPPEHEDCGPFIDVSARLVGSGLNAPQVLAQDLQRGFLLLSDLGTRTYLPELQPDAVDALYADAMQALQRMQQQVSSVGLPVYDEARLTAELELFPTWFLQRHLGWAEDCHGWDRIEQTFMRLLAAAAEQPQTFVHRDFHSRNLMITGNNNPGILDFQDAVHGPITYDLVSLLKDCYVRWPDAQVQAWSEQYRQLLAARGIAVPGPTRWRRWFDWMGLQRHLKVLGIFARLHYRDGKSGYLADLPRVLGYVLDTCARYGELAGFGEWLAHLTRGLDLSQPGRGAP
jgi:aminoglycoside/choline kinase family phosphotransferase